MYFFPGFFSITKKFRIRLAVRSDFLEWFGLKFAFLVEDKGKPGFTDVNFFYQVVKGNKVYCSP